MFLYYTGSVQIEKTAGGIMTHKKILNKIHVGLLNLFKFLFVIKQLFLITITVDLPLLLVDLHFVLLLLDLHFVLVLLLLQFDLLTLYFRLTFIFTLKPTCIEITSRLLIINIDITVLILFDKCRFALLTTVTS
jgi:hypothetical protein